VRAILLWVLSLTAACGGGSAGPDGGDTRATSSTLCARFIACAGATNPIALPAIQQAYGPGGTCFEPQRCSPSARTPAERGLSQLRAGGAGAPACACNSDAECLEPGFPYCDPLVRVCGQCRRSTECSQPSACVRSPGLGTRCLGCAVAGDSEVCGQSRAVAPDLWSAAPYCTFEDNGTRPASSVRPIPTAPVPGASPPAVRPWHRAVSGSGSVCATRPWSARSAAPVAIRASARILAPMPNA
jgi:hypothetical protein